MLDKIIVDGYKLIGADSIQSYSSKELTRFELKKPTPEEISKLKEGDEVLIKCKIAQKGNVHTRDGYRVFIDTIIAILPQPQQEFCECNDPDFQCAICEKWMKPIHPEPKKDNCGICGGKQVYIRGRNPHTDKRLVCPTCCQERLEQIKDISDSDYGKAGSTRL